MTEALIFRIDRLFDLQAIDPATDMVRKLELEEQLLRYGRFDTEAMVEIVKFFT